MRWCRSLGASDLLQDHAAEIQRLRREGAAPQAVTMSVIATKVTTINGVDLIALVFI